MRRLPVFFLIDVSESMVGEPIRNVHNGIQMIMGNLKSNPMALESVYVSVIVFAGKAKTLVPLKYILDFELPELPVGGGTALGNAMDFLMDEIKKQVQKTTTDMKGDWKPIVFLLTDGAPTDQCTSAIKRWKLEFKGKATLITIAMAETVDLDILREFTDNVLQFKGTNSKDYKDFFQWISASIETTSKNIISGMEEEINTLHIDNALIEIDNKEKNSSFETDEKFTILLSRCQKIKKLYLIKYEKQNTGNYEYEGSYSVSEDYFELTEGHEQKVQSDKLFGMPFCPYCKSSFWGMCVCGKVLCLKAEDPYNTCPWCGQTCSYQVGIFNVNKAQG